VVTLKVEDLIKRKPITVPRNATVLEAVNKMVSENIGLVVVVGSDPKSPLGVVSERDVMRAVASGTPLSSEVWEIASKNLVTLNRREDVGKAALTMATHRIRHLVISDDSNCLLGVVSIRDLVAERSTLEAIVSSYGEEPWPGGD
jgi:signal-transduction protein with cAMP-binding, CBS, and nucleotidyltransferase domain